MQRVQGMGSISGNMCLYIPYSINIHRNAYYAWKVSDITGIIPYSMHNRCIPPTPARTQKGQQEKRKEGMGEGIPFSNPQQVKGEAVSQSGRACSGVLGVGGVSRVSTPIKNCGQPQEGGHGKITEPGKIFKI